MKTIHKLTKPVPPDLSSYAVKADIDRAIALLASKTDLRALEDATARVNGNSRDRDTALGDRITPLDSAIGLLVDRMNTAEAAITANATAVATTNGRVTANATAIANANTAITANTTAITALNTKKYYSIGFYRNDGGVVSIGSGSPTWTNVRFNINDYGYTSANLLHSSGDIIIPKSGRVLVESKWWNANGGDERIHLRHKNSGGTTIKDYSNVLTTTSKIGNAPVIITATQGDRINWVGFGAAGLYWAENHSEIRIHSLD